LIKGPSLTCVYVDISSDTDNELTTEVGGYEHVVVLRNTKVVDEDILEALQQLPRGTTDGDCIHKFLVFSLCYVRFYLLIVNIFNMSKYYHMIFSFAVQ